MKRCIFCGKSEDEFDSKNMWSDEHIIPECLGNSTLRQYGLLRRHFCTQICSEKLLDGGV